MKNKIKQLIVCSIVFGLCTAASAQVILLDEPVKAGELTLFPSINDPNAFYYLTDKPKIATGPNGKPQFSFLRYVDNAVATGAEGEGGGIVHAVIVLEVTEDQRRTAEQELQRIRSGAKIQGPAIFSSGKIALISSIAQPNGEFSKQVLGLGNAPLLDGHKAAISVQLTKLGAKILRESFNTPTPDMSISFEMTLQGYRSPKRVLIEAEFDQVYENKTMQLAAAVHGPVLVGAEITAAFEDLRKSGAIKVTQIGTDPGLEKALETAYNKLINMMFDPAGGTGSPNISQIAGATGMGGTSLLDRATNTLRDERERANRRNDALRVEERNAATERERLSRETVPAEAVAPPRPTGSGEDRSLRDDVVVGPREARRPSPRGGAANGGPGENAIPRDVVPTASVFASFQMKRIHQQGSFKIDLNKYTVDNLVLRFDENFGQIKCDECFHDVNLADPLYQQREVYSYLDGFNSQDFGKYINFVNVTMRKTHENGDVTNSELRIDKSNFNESGNNFKMVYGWKEDANRLKWLDYDYKVAWNYFGGYTQEANWVKSTIGTIPLSSPYVRQLIDIEADPDNFTQNSVRSAEIKIYFPLGTQEQVRTIRLNPKTGQLSGQVDVLMPANKLEYTYEVNWFLINGTTKSTGRLPGRSSIIYVDIL